jgi:hypothetical protein
LHEEEKETSAAIRHQHQVVFIVAIKSMTAVPALLVTQCVESVIRKGIFPKSVNLKVLLSLSLLRYHHHLLKIPPCAIYIVHHYHL